MSTSHTIEDSRSDVDSFNALEEREARALLVSCLAVPRWVSEVLAGRPYDTGAALLDRAGIVARTLSEDEVDAALARHPRIGEQPGEGHDVEFSQSEQAGVTSNAEPLADALRVGNAEYEHRFSRVFLIRAAGRTSGEVLSELRRRLANGKGAELAETVGQLGEIAVLRLKQVLAR